MNFGSTSDMSFCLVWIARSLQLSALLYVERSFAKSFPRFRMKCSHILILSNFVELCWKIMTRVCEC